MEHRGREISLNWLKTLGVFLGRSNVRIESRWSKWVGEQIKLSRQREWWALQPKDSALHAGKFSMKAWFQQLLFLGDHQGHKGWGTVRGFRCILEDTEYHWSCESKGQQDQICNWQRSLSDFSLKSWPGGSSLGMESSNILLSILQCLSIWRWHETQVQHDSSKRSIVVTCCVSMIKTPCKGRKAYLAHSFQDFYDREGMVKQLMSQQTSSRKETGEGQDKIQPSRILLPIAHFLQPGSATYISSHSLISLCYKSTKGLAHGLGQNPQEPILHKSLSPGKQIVHSWVHGGAVPIQATVLCPLEDLQALRYVLKLLQFDFLIWHAALIAVLRDGV